MICDHWLFYVAGLLVTFAYDDISYHKVATQSNTYLGRQQNEAKSAVDRNTLSCMRADTIGRSSPDKTVWWKVDLGGVFNIYSINILFKNYDGFVERQTGRFAGFSMYVSNSNVLSNADIQGSTLCYKDGAALPSLNFTTVCTEKGRYVIYYNERLDGVIYPEGYEVENIFTELCEVIVQGCNNAGFYGRNCNTPCPNNCKDNTCHIQNGTCFSCIPGWAGVYCDTKCREGLHGINCSQQCVGRCRDGVTCNHVTGTCDGGCDAGWTGIFCNKDCNDGRYGYNCVNNCSGHCLNNSPCNKQTGQCDRGCSPGYTTDNCSKVCRSGHYGKNCIESCSGHCINNEPCEHVSGVCMSGCQDGFVGAHCNNSCNKGYFGTNCSQKCSPYCRPDTCRHTDGSCTTCAAGCPRYNCTTGGPENIIMKQDNSSCITLAIGLSVSLFFNLILIGCGILLCRRIKSKRVTVPSNLLSCWKKSVYQDTIVRREDTSTYQELDLSVSVYQNATIR